jgi:hypothetical protein
LSEQPETLVLRRKFFFTIANDSKEYEKSVIPTESLLEELRKRKVDIFTFLERKWCCPIPNPSKSWIKANDNIALLKITSYEGWWKSIGKKTRNMIRKAEKSGIRTATVEPDEKLAEGIWRIYNETPIRQERAFPHYGVSLEAVKRSVFSLHNSTYIAAYLKNELVGFARLGHGDNITHIDQILSLQKHWDKAVNNALVAKVVEFCASREIHWLMYGRMGNHPSLDSFKQSNGCTQFPLTRYYVILSRKGKIAVKLGLHREIKDVLPQSAKRPLIHIYNWIDRTKMITKLGLRRKRMV